MQHIRPVHMVACDSAHAPAGMFGWFIGEWVIKRIYDELAARRSRSLFDQLTTNLDTRPPTRGALLTSHPDDRDVRTLAGDPFLNLNEEKGGSCSTVR